MSTQMVAEAGGAFTAEDINDIGGFFERQGIDPLIPIATGGRAVFPDGVALVESAAATAAQVAEAWRNRCASIGLALNTLDAVITKQFDDLMDSIFGTLGAGLDDLAVGMGGSTSERVVAATGLLQTAASASGGDVWTAIIDVGLDLVADFLKGLLERIFGWLKRSLINVLRAALNAAFGCPADGGGAPIPGDPAAVATQSGGTPSIPTQIPASAPAAIPPPPNPMATFRPSTAAIMNRLNRDRFVTLPAAQQLPLLNIPAGRQVLPGVPGQNVEPVIPTPTLSSPDEWEWWPYALIAGVVGVGIYASKK